MSTLFDTLYDNNGEDYSPGSEFVPDVAQAVPVIATHGVSPFQSANPIPAAFVPRPPDPAVGGQGGSMGVLGWSTGRRNGRAFRQRFGGQTLVVPAMGVHPIQGPVGFSTRTDRLTYKVDALTGDDIPTDESVGSQYADPNQSALVAATRGNPNYG